jgi:hypothetical protein
VSANVGAVDNNKKPTSALVGILGPWRFIFVLSVLPGTHHLALKSGGINLRGKVYMKIALGAAHLLTAG